MATTTSTIPQNMHAIYHTTYGPPATVLHLRTDAPVPTPQPHQILLRIHAVSPHAGDWHLIRGTPLIVRLLFSGLSHPKLPIPGTDAAGVVVAVGSAVHDLTVGDRVFGDLSASGFGAFAEYATVNAQHVAKMPSTWTFHQAAPLGVSAIAAIQAVRDVACVKEGMNVLVTGASGGVGSFAVQIACAYGARVTATCRHRKMDAVRRLGAEHVVDWEKEDVTDREDKFDAVVDAAMFRSPMDYVRVLKEGGRYVGVGGQEKFFFQIMLGMGMWMSAVKKRPSSFLDSKPVRNDLEAVRSLVEEGKVEAMVDEEQFGLEDIPKAIVKIEERKVVGKIVVDVVKE